MKSYLLITLGHNSSAIFVDNSQGETNVIGYEQERLSRIKSDSKFPIDAINEIEKNVGYYKMKGCEVRVSHWFNFSMFAGNKYITSKDIDKLKSYEPESIVEVNDTFTHHDAHAYSVDAFFKFFAKGANRSKQYNTIVIDGFGNNEEVFSIYSSCGNKPSLMHRAYGYELSLGLYYQFATSFVGMKENRDEYKFLGYESYVEGMLTEEQLTSLYIHASDHTQHFTNGLLFASTVPQHSKNEVIDTSKLNSVKKLFYEKFADVIKAVGVDENDNFTVRVVIAHLIQSVCEATLKNIIEHFNVINLCVAGGVFYNVKLNNHILQCVKGQLCIMPLAGDQGAAIGMYHKEQDGFPFDTLCWGKRDFYGAEKFERNDGGKIRYFSFSKSGKHKRLCIARLIANDIKEGKLVNVVDCNMEFGPRALGHTSTLFLPSKVNTEFNNAMNKRNEVMPCAPICTRESVYKMFDKEDVDRIIGSDYFMICTHVYTKQYSSLYNGVMHKIPFTGHYSGRPQIVQEGFMRAILEEVEDATDMKCLVNTSFNVHGNPIVFSVKDIVDNFNFQCENAADCTKVALYIINEHE